MTKINGLATTWPQNLTKEQSLQTSTVLTQATKSGTCDIVFLVIIHLCPVEYVSGRVEPGLLEATVQDGVDEEEGQDEEQPEVNSPKLALKKVRSLNKKIFDLRRSFGYNELFIVQEVSDN